MSAVYNSFVGRKVKRVGSDDHAGTPELIAARRTMRVVNIGAWWLRGQLPFSRLLFVNTAVSAHTYNLNCHRMMLDPSVESTVRTPDPVLRRGTLFAWLMNLPVLTQSISFSSEDP